MAWPLPQHQIEEMRRGIDDDGARALAGRVGNDLAQELLVDLLDRHGRDLVALVVDRAVHRRVVAISCVDVDGRQRLGGITVPDISASVVQADRATEAAPVAASPRSASAW